MKLKLLIVIGLMALIASSVSLEADFIQCVGAGGCDGSNFADIINGSILFDVIEGFDGNDLIFGNDGPDTILGFEGLDILFGGNGSDEMGGLDGNDHLLPGPDDGIYSQGARGDEGNDVLYTFASETSTCLFLFGWIGQDTVNLIGYGPYSALHPFGQTGWDTGWVVVTDPILGGNVLIRVEEDNDDGVDVIHGLTTPNVTIMTDQEINTLLCPALHPDINT
jgi:Ca2+-binding RTX toxin-like protein